MRPGVIAQIEAVPRRCGRRDRVLQVRPAAGRWELQLEVVGPEPWDRWVDDFLERRECHALQLSGEDVLRGDEAGAHQRPELLKQGADHEVHDQQEFLAPFAFRLCHLTLQLGDLAMARSCLPNGHDDGKERADDANCEQPDYPSRIIFDAEGPEPSAEGNDCADYAKDGSSPSTEPVDEPMKSFH